MRNIFLSFCGADRQVKDEIKEYLEAQNKGYHILHSDEFCGSDFPSECILKIRQSQIFVAIVSEATMLEGGFCKEEIIEARKCERMGKLNILLFKLTDSEYTPDFAFLLNSRSDLNNLTRGTKNGYPHLEKKIEYFLQCREGDNPEYEDVYDALPLAALNPISGPNYRQEEVRRIEKAFEDSNVVFLQGVNGMGKIHTARSYLQTHTFMRAYRADVCGKLRDFILMIDFSSYAGSRLETDLHKRYNQNLQWLARMSPNVLIVANHVSTEDLDEDVVHDLQKCGAKLLITTASAVPDETFPVVEVGPMEDSALAELFFNRLGCGLEDRIQIRPYLPNLIRAVGKHTGALMFIADTFKTRLYDAQSIIESIEALDFGDGTPGDLAQKSISHFFGVDTLTEMEKNILFYMAWVQYRYISVDALRRDFKHSGVKDLSAVHSLKVKGYIQPDGDYALYIPETVAIVAREQILPSPIALQATLRTLFDDFELLQFPVWRAAVADFADRYALQNRQAALDALDKMFAMMQAMQRLDLLEEFLEAYKKLKDLPEDIHGFGEAMRAYCVGWIDIAKLNDVDEAFIQKADAMGVQEDFISDTSWQEMLGDTDELPASFQDLLTIDTYSNRVLQKVLDISRNQNATMTDLQEMDGQVKSLLRIFERELVAGMDDSDGLDALNSLNAFYIAVTTMISVRNYDGVISLYNTYWKEFDKDLPDYDIIQESLLFSVFLAYQSNGNQVQAYRIGQELCQLPCHTVQTDNMRKLVDIALLKIDLERKDFVSAKQRIERLSTLQTLSEEEELMVLSYYARIQMFDGDWYALRTYIASTLERYREVESGYIENLREQYEECQSIIDSIEGVETVITNEREIMDASDYNAYRKYLRQQMSSADYKSCAHITDTVMKQDLSVLTDEELRQQCKELSWKMQRAQRIEDHMIISAFCLIREAGQRVLEMKHHLIQVFAASIMLKGYSTQIRNGEGKTFTIVLVAGTMAMMGRGVDVISSSEYLSIRDYKWMEGIYRLLGISVGEMNNYRESTVQNQVTYCSIRSLMHKYNADRRRFARPTAETKQLDCAIVDEADLIMVDDRVQAYTYVETDWSTQKKHIWDVKLIYRMIADGTLDESDYSISKRGGVTVYQSALEKLACEIRFSMEDIASTAKYRQLLETGIQVVRVWKNGEDYYLRNGRPYCENTTTGQGYAISGDNLNFLICKERLSLPMAAQQDKVYASCVGYVLRRYQTLIGTSGTMMAGKNTFEKFYGIRCVDIPTNQKICRVDRGYSLYANEHYHLQAVVEQIRQCVHRQQPVLVVTPDAKRQELIERRLQQEGICYNSVSYKNDEEAARIFALAGLPGAVTVSTNLAGRGVDVILGGNPKQSAIQEMRELGYSEADIELAQTVYPTEDPRTLMLRGFFVTCFRIQKNRSQSQRETALAAGGLYVIGTFLMGSLRHEEQICGRSGRQGEPGESEFIVSFEDENLSVYFGESQQVYLRKLMGDLKTSHPFLTESLKNVQIKREDSLLKAPKKVREIENTVCRILSDYVERILADEAFAAEQILLAARISDGDAKVQDICARAAEIKQKQSDPAFGQSCADGAADVTIELPKDLIEAELDAQMERFARQLQISGYSIEQYARMMGGDVNTMRNAFRPGAEKAVRNALGYGVEEQAEINVTAPRKTAIQKFVHNVKKEIFRKKTVLPSMEALLGVLSYKATVDLFEQVLAASAERTLTALLAQCERIDQEQTRLAVLNNTTEADRMKTVEKRIMEECKTAVAGLIEEVYNTLSKLH